MENNFDLDGSERDFGVYIDGDKLNPETASNLESALEADDSNLAVRLQLLFYYSQKQINNVEAWLLLVSWMIRHRPKDWISANLQWPTGVSEAQFLQLKALWLTAIEQNPNDPILLGRAGRFISVRDKTTAESFLKRAQLIDKENIYWGRLLTNNYINQAFEQKGINFLEYARRAFDAGDAVLSAEQQDGERNGMLTRLCNLALKIKDVERANHYASELKRCAEENGLNHRMFQAYSYLGKAALLCGDIEKAKKCLLHSSELGFFSDLSLANGLLEIGERSAVLAFLRKSVGTAGEWSANITRWISEVENGKNPELKLS